MEILKLFQRNETWHALNSAFPDINCMVSFWINPHQRSNLGLGKQYEIYFMNMNGIAQVCYQISAKKGDMTFMLTWFVHDI